MGETERVMWKDRTPEQWQKATYCDVCGLPLIEIETGEMMCVYCTWIMDESSSKGISERVSSVIYDYFEKRRLMMPNPEQSLMWAMSEVGESADELLRKNRWVRNNKEKEIPFDARMYAEELGDAIMMLMISGLASGENPLYEMFSKMRRKIIENYTGKS